MVPTFDKFIFNNPIGSIGIVETDFGFHVIKVDDKYNSVLLGTIAQRIEPSEETIDNIYTIASKFEAEANEKDFDVVAKASKLEVIPATNIKSFEEYIQGLGAQRAIISWSFNTDNSIGDVKRFDIPQGYVIAKLKSRNETGLMSVDVAKDIVTPLIKNEKKAALIKAKMTGTTLETIAKSSGASIISAGELSLSNPIIPNIGSETKVIGTAFNTAKGKVSSLIEGTNGVYCIKTTNLIAAPASNNNNGLIAQELTQQKSSAQSRAYQALKEKAIIKDNRSRF